MSGVPSGAHDVLVTAEPYVHSVDHDEGFDTWVWVTARF